MKMLRKINILLVVLYCFSGFSKQEKNTVIINNEAKSSSSAGQVISAPALVPSDAMKLRSFREKQEIKTEDSILKELEKQRLLDEQKRVDKILGQGKPAQTVNGPSSQAGLNSSLDDLFFGQKSFVSFGAGVVHYPDVININSTKQPAIFAGFGAYGYEGFLIFEMSAYYSKHYLKTPNRNYLNVREVVDQPALSMAVKLTPFKGRVKPYVGLSGSVIGRDWDYVHKDGTPRHEMVGPGYAKYDELEQDVAQKGWYFSFDAGAAIGADIALGDYLGLNVDMRYYFNLHTENRSSSDHKYKYLVYTEVLDKRDSIIFSANLRYYFQ